jgi:hypothetical protein
VEPWRTAKREFQVSREVVTGVKGPR